jgi:hypothetical protein
MIVAPLLWVASALASPPLQSDNAAQVATIARHPDRWYWYALLTLAGSIVVVAALAGLVTRLKARDARAAYLGGTLAQLGALIAVGDSATELLVWQTGAPGADQSQMAALLSRYDAAPGASIVFTVGGLAMIAGMVVLAVGLIRTRTAPAWAAALLPIATVLNIVAFGAASQALLVVSYLLLLAAFARIAAPDVAPGGLAPAPQPAG